MKKLLLFLSVVLSLNATASTDSTALDYANRCAALRRPLDSINIFYLSNFITRIKTEMGKDGITPQFNSLDAFYVFTEGKDSVANDLQAKKASLLNLLNANFAGSIITDLLPNTSHVYGKGWVGKTGKLVVNTNYNPFDGLHTYKFTRNNNAFGCYSITNTLEVCGLISNLDASSNGYELKSHTSGIIAVNGNATVISTMTPDLAGGFASMRSSSTNTAVYKNAKSTASSAVASNATVNKTFKLFARDINGVYSLGTNNTIAFAWFGSSNVDINKLETAFIEEYLKPIGAAITKVVQIDGNSYISNINITQKLMNKLWANGVKCTSLYNGVSGINYTTMISNLPIKIKPYEHSYWDKQCYIPFETFNTLKGTGTVAGTCNLIQTYIDSVRSYGFTNIVLTTCTPFKLLDSLKRENPNDINDSTRFNGYVRRFGVTRLGADYICDPASNMIIFPDSHGVAGVGEKNTFYYMLDEQHWKGPAEDEYVNNKLYPIIYSILH